MPERQNVEIPEFNQSGVLPPFIPGENPANSNSMAPYKTTLFEIVNRFATNAERIKILKGFIEYRKFLRKSGIIDGFQWIDGSYVENCEYCRNNPPKDIDIVTFAERPNSCIEDNLWLEFVKKNNHLFNRPYVKKTFYCDAFYIDLALPGKIIVSRSRYWFGLFSHQRVSYIWKGLLEISLQSDDQEALSFLNERNNYAT